MSSDRLEVSVTFDAERGYVASAPELRQPIVALSLGGLRRRMETVVLPDDVRCSSMVSPSANATAAGRSWCAEPGIRACIHKIAIGNNDLIKVRFAPLCGLKSDILGGPRSAIRRHMQCSKLGVVVLFSYRGSLAGAL